MSLGFLSLSAYYFSHGSSVARVWDLPVWNFAHYAMSSLGFQASACCLVSAAVSVTPVHDLLVWNSAHYAMSSLGFLSSAHYFSHGCVTHVGTTFTEG